MDAIPIISRQRAALLLGFVLLGIALATWVSRIPSIQAALNLSEAALGLTLVGSSAGVLFSLSAAGGLIARFGSKRVALMGAGLIYLALPLLALSPNAYILGAVLFLFGSGISLLDVAINDQAVLVERAAGRPLMSSFHAGFSVGGLIGALFGAGMAALPAMTPLPHFIIVSAASAAGLLVVSPALVENQNRPVDKPPAFRVPDRALWLLGFIAFCAAIGEGAMESWSAVYLTRVFETPESYAALGFAAFSLTMTVGRVFGDALARAWPSERIIRLGGCLAAAGLAAAVLTPRPAVVLVGFAVVGLGLANIIPLAFSAAGNTAEIPAGTAIAGVAAIGYAGFLAGPPVIGLVAEATSLRVGIALVALMVGSLVVTGRAVAGGRRGQGAE